jgi:hypothetical protein
MTKKEEKEGKEKKDKKCEKEEGKVPDRKKKKVKSTSDAMQVRCGWRAPTGACGRRGVPLL